MKIKRKTKVTIKLELTQEEFNTIALAVDEMSITCLRERAKNKGIKAVEDLLSLYNALKTWRA